MTGAKRIVLEVGHDYPVGLAQMEAIGAMIPRRVVAKLSIGIRTDAGDPRGTTTEWPSHPDRLMAVLE